MRILPLSAALLIFLDDLEYTEAALLADDEVVGLAAPFTAEIEAWPQHFTDERRSRRDVTRAEAVVAVRNSLLDRTTTRFGATVMAEAGGNRKAPLVARFFPVATSIFVRSPLRKQCEHTLDVILLELGKLDAKSALKGFATPLEAQAKGALAALDTRSKAKASRASKSHDVDEYKEGINALRLSTYAELLKLATEKGYPRSWADTFYRVETAVVEAPAALPAGADEAPGDGAWKSKPPPAP